MNIKTYTSEVTVETVYNDDLQDLVHMLFDEQQVHSLVYRPSGDWWFLPRYEFKAYISEPCWEEDKVSLHFSMVPDTYVDHTDYSIFAKTLRFLWRYRLSRWVIEVAARWNTRTQDVTH